jgi:hypothetical protein
MLKKKKKNVLELDWPKQLFRTFVRASVRNECSRPVAWAVKGGAGAGNAPDHPIPKTPLQLGCSGSRDKFYPGLKQMSYFEEGQVFVPREPPQRMVFDGKRMRKPIIRKTVDYGTDVMNWHEV